MAKSFINQKKQNSKNLSHLSWMGRKEDFKVCVGGESDLTPFSWSKMEINKATYEHWNVEKNIGLHAFLVCIDRHV